MNYFPFHLGDYAAHTAHLEPLEDLAYRRMLDHYYLHEAPLPAEPAEVARLVRMRGNVAEVAAVLQEFFTPTDAGWVSARCEEELARMQDRQGKAKAAAEASVAARQAKAANGGAMAAQRPLSKRATPVGQADGAGPAGAEPPIPTPTPRPTPEIPPGGGGQARRRTVAAACAMARPGEVAEQTWADWTTLRAKKRAPVTQTVLDEARRECAKAGLTLERFLQVWCMRGSQGLLADWLRPEERGPGPGGAAAPVETAYQRSMRERVREAAPGIARRAPAAVHQDAADFFRTVEASARVLPDIVPSTEVMP